MRRFPDRPAVSVRHEDRVARFTYLQLDALARGAASFLAVAGLAPGDRCAILAENSARWCAAYLGILRLGAIAVPIDTSYTPTQVASLLRDCGACVLLASTRSEAIACEAGAAAGCRVSTLDAATHPVASGPAECPASASAGAVILYTSGATDDPKGVVLTHANLLAGNAAAFGAMAVSEQDSILGTLPLFHSFALTANLLLPFSVGAHAVFLETLDTRELLRALDEEAISIVVCSPQCLALIHQRVTADGTKSRVPARAAFHGRVRLNRLLRRAGATNAGRWLFPRAHRALGRRMRMLIAGGSKLDEAVGRDLHDLGLTILQAYGPAETSGAAAVTRPGDPIHTVGRALPGVDIRTIPASDSEVGEILIRGPVVMKGYWNRPHATADVLRDGWLHTGDFGRLDDEGRLTIAGRSQEVIALGSGRTIYAGEVEAHYRRSPFIRELCVVGIAPAGGPPSLQLHAVVVPEIDVLRERRIANTRELIRFELEGLSVLLPAHERVLGFDVRMEPLPRTATGTLKRFEILERCRAGRPGPRDARAARPADAHVARVVALVQGAVRAGLAVHPDASLELDLGLDSMERVELLVSLEQRFGMRLSDETAQGAFLVRDLAEAFRGATETPGAAHLPWASLLEAGEPGAEQRALLATRTGTALLVFCIARLLVRVLARVTVEGVEHLPSRGPFILSPNHQSYLDPFVLVAVLPFGVFRRLFFVGAAEYFETAIARAIARRLNVVPVDPDANLVPAMQAGAFGLRHGKVLVLFPEGERSIDGSVKQFRKGAAILSQHLEAPIVPVAISGLFEMWPRSRPLDWRRLLPWSGHRASIRFGPRIDPPEPGTSCAEHTAALRTAVEQMWVLATRSCRPRSA